MSADDAISTQVVAILAAQALRAPSDLSRDTTLDSLGIDSLGLAEILFAIEETFDVAVPFNANAPDAGGLDLRNVGSVCDAVAALIDGRRA
ncbi:MAG: acyl carrier protein [Pararhodobacter sp.]|nr:acyl carrier protein [Pararhodobacter sp.]